MRFTFSGCAHICDQNEEIQLYHRVAAKSLKPDEIYDLLDPPLEAGVHLEEDSKRWPGEEDEPTIFEVFIIPPCISKEIAYLIQEALLQGGNQDRSQVEKELYVSFFEKCRSIGQFEAKRERRKLRYEAEEVTHPQLRLSFPSFYMPPVVQLNPEANQITLLFDRLLAEELWPYLIRFSPQSNRDNFLISFPLKQIKIEFDQEAGAIRQVWLLDENKKPVLFFHDVPDSQIGHLHAYKKEFRKLFEELSRKVSEAEKGVVRDVAESVAGALLGLGRLEGLERNIQYN